MKPPARALRLTMQLDADTPEDMAWALRNLAYRVEAKEVTRGCWGSPSDGAIYELLTDPEMTHDIFHQKVREYLASKEDKP